MDAGIEIVRKDLANVFLCREALRPRLGGERGLLFVGEMNCQRHNVVAFASTSPILRQPERFVTPSAASVVGQFEIVAASLPRQMAA